MNPISGLQAYRSAEIRAHFAHSRSAVVPVLCTHLQDLHNISPRSHTYIHGERVCLITDLEQSGHAYPPTVERRGATKHNITVGTRYRLVMFAERTAKQSSLTVFNLAGINPVACILPPLIALGNEMREREIR